MLMLMSQLLSLVCKNLVPMFILMLALLVRTRLLELTFCKDSHSKLNENLKRRAMNLFEKDGEA